MVTIYGLKTCDTCRKSRQAIEKSGKDVNFIDVRDTPLSEDLLKEFISTFGDALINSRSTTWRSLNEQERQGTPLELLTKHPTLMKRPVIAGADLTLGWNAAAQKTHLG